MTVSSSTNKIIGSGNGVTTSWPFTFPCFDATHLQVIYTDAAGAESTLSASAYTVSLNSDQAANPGGTVTYSPAIASGTKLTILRGVPYTQATDIKNQGGYFPEVLERAIDLVVMQVQQLKEQLARAFKLSPSQSAIGELEATDANRANTFLGFGPTGLLTLFSGLASTAVSLAMQPVIAAVSLAAGRAALGAGGVADNNTWSGTNAFNGAVSATSTVSLIAPTADAHAARRIDVLQGDRLAIAGLTYANNVGDATNDIDFAAGVCMSDDGTELIVIAATTKQLDVAQAADNGATPSGMLGSAGGALGNHHYIAYAIKNPTTGECRIVAEQETVALALPSGFTKKRAVAFIKRSAGAILPFTTSELGGGGLRFEYLTGRLDANLVNTVANTRTTITLTSAPQTFSVKALLRAGMGDATETAAGIIGPISEVDAAPAGGAVPLANFAWPAGGNDYKDLEVRTSATGTIAARANVVGTVDGVLVLVRGFEWSRR